jgi:hypothetical protein
MDCQRLPAFIMVRIAGEIRNVLLPAVNIVNFAREITHSFTPTLIIGHMTGKTHDSVSPTGCIFCFTRESSFELPFPAFLVVFAASRLPRLISLSRHRLIKTESSCETHPRKDECTHKKCEFHDS